MFWAIVGMNLLWCIVGIAASRAAWRNGVTDGYGFAKEPWNPAYRKTGDFLEKYMVHRWPHIKQNASVQAKQMQSMMNNYKPSKESAELANQ